MENKAITEEILIPIDLSVRYNKRRILITEESKTYQILSLVQEKDGSIYCHWPDFTKTKWLDVLDTKYGTSVIITDSPGEGKMTFHGSGMAGFKKHKGSYKVDCRVKNGNYLMSKDGGILGIRHLFTALIRKPYLLPASPRKSDYIISVSKIEPIVLLFLAIPMQEITIEFTVGDIEDQFQEENLELSFVCSRLIEMKKHLIFWVAYKTKNMEEWPDSTLVLFDNGFNIPLIFSLRNNTYRIELRSPLYEFEGSKLKITM
jgi:hypothetical protein